MASCQCSRNNTYHQSENDMENENAREVSQDSKNMAVLIWVGTIFLSFIPGLAFYLIKKDDPYILDQAKESLNWSITACIGYFAGFLLTFIVIGVFIIPLVILCNLVFSIMGAVAASTGKEFRTPFAIRLIK